MQEKYGLSSTGLKAIAAVLMLLDHIHQFFAYTNYIPNIFTQLGRLSAPIFLFLLVEGFFKTKSRFKYFLKVYAVGAAMILVRAIIELNGLYISYDSIPINGMLSMFAALLLLFEGFELIKKRRYILGILICALVLVLPYPVAQLVFSASVHPAVYYLIMAFAPMHTLAPDGGTLIIICGIAMYIFRNNRILQAVAFIVSGNAYYFWTLYRYIGVVEPAELFYPYCQWMMLFSVVLMLLYNGKRGGGKHTQRFFYLFYPIHIYVLYFTAYFLQKI